MVGQLMVEAAIASGQSPDLDLSLVERYSDGTELSEGRMQGIRFDIRGSVPSFRIGVGREESGDVTIEVTAAAARELNRLYSVDPSYPTTRDGFLGTGEMRVTGDPSRLGAWPAAVHDPIVARTV